MTENPASKPAAGLYLDDLAVGDVFRSGEYALDAQQITEFAARFDPQPFHLDDRAARQTLFGGLAASGWHTAAITMRLLVLSGLPLADGIIGAGADLSWPQPTRPGDVLHVESHVDSIAPSRSRPRRATVIFTNQTLNQRGEVLQIMITRLIVERRPGG